MMTPSDIKPNPPPKWWKPLWELTKHVFIGVSVFLLLAIPAIALDFFNQGIELIEIDRSTVKQEAGNSQSEGKAAEPIPPEKKVVEPIRVSYPVKLTLHIIEYFILGVDVIFVVAYLVNGMWHYLKSLKW